MPRRIPGYFWTLFIYMAQPFSVVLTLPPQPWSIGKKLLFRTSFLFFVLFIFLNANEILPLSNPFYDFYIQPFHFFVPWAGKHILHLSYEITSFSNGSLDTTFDYLMLLLMTVLTLLGTLIWTLADRRRSDYKVLYYWLTVLIRYYCVYSMFSYGLSKVYKLQFGFPSPGSLVQPLGTYSPMHLAWSFFGYSRPYSYFMGLAEVVTGVLLLYKRTTRLGAILLLVVMTNVMAVNYFYDVCLKIVSTMLVVMALFLLLQDRRRLINFFFLNRATEPECEWKPQFHKRWINISLVFKYGLTIAILWNINAAAISLLDGYSDRRPKSSLYGIFNVQTFVKNRETLPPLLTDTTRWRRLVINETGEASYVSVRGMNDSAKSYILKQDPMAGKITIYRATDTTRKFHFDYAFIGEDILRLQGLWKGDSVSVILKRYDLSDLLLVNRGFHWINEAPFQR
jgi:uncharacterized membrane protein YphA (DoxX/SURF4 family)